MSELKLNKAAIRRTARAILAACNPKAKPKIGFNMMDFMITKSMPGDDRTQHSCDTTCCIAGRAQFIHTGKINNGYTAGNYAARLFGLINKQTHWISDDGASDLFLAGRDSYDRSLITPQQAAATLLHLADTGEVDWSAKLSKPKKRKAK